MSQSDINRIHRQCVYKDGVQIVVPLPKMPEKASRKRWWRRQRAAEANK